MAFQIINFAALKGVKLIGIKIMPLSITHHSSIYKCTVSKNGKLLYQAPSGPFALFIDEVYRIFQVAYPKFHKMDNLCKLGLINSHILLNDNYLDIKSNPYKTGVILSNRNSSLDTDIHHQQLIEKKAVSPAVFVYSLPNIVIGEICIKNGIKGENIFFVSDTYEIQNQVRYISSLLNGGVLDSCIGGLVDLVGKEYHAFMYLVEKNNPDGSFPFNADNISKIYTTPVYD